MNRVITDDDFELPYGCIEVLKTGYVCITRKVNGKRVREYLHRYVIGAKDGEIVDHINQNPLDNRKDNLRIVSRTQNAFNKDMYNHNTSGWRGVSYNKRAGKWFAQVKYKQENIYLGSFNDAEDAASCAYAAREQLFDVGA